MNNHIRNGLLGGAALFAMSAPAFAQQAASERDSSEIIVTANKREQNAQDVGIAVSAVSGAALEAFSGQGVTALSKFTPGVQIQPVPGPDKTVVNIRGVSQNDYAENQEYPVAFYVDGAYMASPAAIGGAMFDVDRIEILRGPQGTLFGRNATGGLVQVITNKPTKSLEGFVTVSAERFSLVQTEGGIGGPISDRVRARFSFASANGGDYIKNLIGRDQGASNFYAGRLQLEADVGDGGKLNIKVQRMRNDHDRSNSTFLQMPGVLNSIGQGVAIGPNDNPYGTCKGCDGFGNSFPYSTRAGKIDDRSFFDRTATSATVSYQQDLGNATLFSVTDYNVVDKEYLYGSPYVQLAATDQKSLTKQFSQELRITGNAGPLVYTVGAYYMYYDVNTTFFSDLTGFRNAVLSNFGFDLGFNTLGSTYRQKTNALATFAQLEYSLTDAFKVIGGIRYGWDWKNIDVNNSFDGVVLPAKFNPTLFPALAKRLDKDWTGKIELDYKVADKIMLYASVNRGYKGGGFNTGVFPIAPEKRRFSPEILTNYEGGIKTTLFDGSTTFNVTGFHYDYKNYQSFQPAALIFTLANVNAKVDGAEAELTTRPLKGLYITSFVAYLNGRALNVLKNVSSNRMPNSPKFSAGGLIRQDFDVGSGKLGVQVSGKFNSSQYLSVLNQPVTFQPAYFSGDAQIDYTFDSLPLKVAVFVTNFTDKDYLLHVSDDVDPFMAWEGNYAKPRVVGARVTYHFK